MTKLNLTVRAEVVDPRGQSFVTERHIVSHTQDNPRFWADHCETDLLAIVGTVVTHIQSEYGKEKLHPDDEKDALCDIVSDFQVSGGGQLSAEDVTRLAHRLLDQGVRLR